MKKNKIVFIVGVLVLAVILTVGCGKTTPSKETTEGKFTNGAHKAELEPDERGWKPIVEVTVKDGKITAANYDEVNGEGKKKSEDKDYGEAMKGASGVSPTEAYKRLEESLIKEQDVDKVEVVTGATDSSNSFKEVTKKALKK